MPRSSGNKGKKKGGGAKKNKSNSTAAANVAPTSSSYAAADRSPSSSLKGKIPNFRELRTINRTQAIRENYPSLYSRYKEATERFVDYMREHSPEGGKSESGVNFLFSAVNLMVETNHVLDPAILSDLKLSIRLRSRVAKSVFGGGDAGHKYFLQALIYCWPLLNSLPKKEAKRDAAVDDHYQENCFAIFEADEDNFEEDEEIFPTRPVHRPDPLDKPMTMKEILASEDRSDAIIFLLTLDELMSAVCNQYEVQMENINFNQRNSIPSSAMVYNLMETAVTANMAIQQVQQLEMELQAHHEHLTTPYRLLSTLIMPDIAMNIMSIMQERASKKCNERDITSFLGDCIECYFRNVTDEYNKRETVVRDFCAKYQVDTHGHSEIEKVFLALGMLVQFEVPLMPEKGENYGLLQQIGGIAGLTGKSHTWLRNMDFIGGDRAIHHTIRLLQMVGSVISSTPLDRSMEPKRGFFGKSPWRAGASKMIHGDMDELIMSDIVPHWVTMCRHGILGRTKLPYETVVCPFFVNVREYVEHAGKPVTWSLAFGVHAMLTGILVADRQLDHIMTVSKQVFVNFFGQTQRAVHAAKQEEEMQRSTTWTHNTAFVLFLENLGLDVFSERMLWNPLCAGTIFSTVSYVGNLYGGCAIIDCQAQLRISMYLYHGLLINGLIHKGDAPLLDHLYDAFRGCKAVWAGSLPCKSELAKRFWICFGMSLKESKRMAEKAQLFANGNVRAFNGFDDGDKSTVRGRIMSPIDPADIATSFRRICCRDFQGVIDKYHTPKQREKGRGSEQYMFAVRSNDTLDAMEEEQEFSTLNFVACGYYLEQFVCSLGRVMQWEPYLKSVDVEGSNVCMRQNFAIIFAQHLLGTLDFSADPLNHQFLNVPIGLAASSFMKGYFQRIPPENVLWFQSTGVAAVHKTTLHNLGPS